MPRYTSSSFSRKREKTFFYFACWQRKREHKSKATTFVFPLLSLAIIHGISAENKKFPSFFSPPTNALSSAGKEGKIPPLQLLLDSHPWNHPLKNNGKAIVLLACVQRKKKKREQRRRGGDGTNVGKEEPRTGLGTGCWGMIDVKLSYYFLCNISITGRASPHKKYQYHIYVYIYITVFWKYIFLS